MRAALYLPDTNLLSAYAANRDAGLVARVEANASEMALSAVVLAEMEYGWRKAGQTKRVRRQKALAAVLALHAFDEDAAVSYDIVKTHCCIGPATRTPSASATCLSLRMLWRLVQCCSLATCGSSPQCPGSWWKTGSRARPRRDLIASAITSD